MKKSDTKSIKANNTALIYDCLLRGIDTRAEIAAASGLSKATVTTITSELIAQGELREVGADGTGAVGRPRVALDIVADYRYAVGISLHRRRLAICLVDLKFDLLDSFSVPTENFSRAEDALDTLYDAMLSMCARHAIPVERIIGIGISCPGPLDYRQGIVHNPPDLALFHNFHVREYLAQKTELPIYLDNNSVLLAMYERRLRKNAHRNWVFVAVTDGIGSAIFSEGTVFRGSGGYAGELGHTAVEAGGIPCACGNRGCLERYISMRALRERFGFEDYKEVAQSAERGSADALGILAYIADKLSVALVNCVNLFDPEAIVLYGELNEAKDQLFPMISQRINRHSAVAAVHSVELSPSLIAERGDLISSADAILNAWFSRKLL